MRVEVVADECDPVRLSVAPVIDELLHLASPIHASAAIARPHASPSGQRLHKHPHHALPFPDILVIDPLGMARSSRYRSGYLGNELLGLLIHAHDRAARIVRPFIDL